MPNETPTRGKIADYITENVSAEYMTYTERCVLSGQSDAAYAIEALYAPYMAELQELRQQAAEVRRATLLEACKVMCPACRVGKSIVVHHSFGWRHEIAEGYRYECEAGPIHALLAQEQAQGVDKNVCPACFRYYGGCLIGVGIHGEKICKSCEQKHAQEVAR